MLSKLKYILSLMTLENISKIVFSKIIVLSPKFGGIITRDRPLDSSEPVIRIEIHAPDSHYQSEGELEVYRH